MTEESAGQRRPKPEDIPPVLELVSQGKSLRAACRELGLGTPHVHRFIDSDPELRQQYARARELRAEHFQEEALSITKAAATGATFEEKTVDPVGVRVYLDAIKWASARMAPKTAPIERHSHSFEALSDDELDAKLKAMEATASAGADARTED